MFRNGIKTALYLICEDCQVTVLDWRFQGKYPVRFISVDLPLVVHEMINNRGRMWMGLVNRLIFCMTLHFCLFGQHLNWWANLQGVATGRLCGWLLSHWGPISTYIFTYQSHNLLLPSSPTKTSHQTLCAYLSFIIIASVCLFTRTQSQLLCM